jgi:hypothetical protein
MAIIFKAPFFLGCMAGNLYFIACRMALSSGIVSLAEANLEL